jgi:chromosomal replication initiation ATPase DnaA
MTQPSTAPPTHKTILADWLIDLVELHFGFERGSLRLPRRGSMQMNEARQLTAYLLNTSLGLSSAQTARCLNRHRSTISHSLNQIESMRDDPVLDRHIDALHSRLHSLTAALPQAQS